jgi:hypothetical protein
MAGHWFAGVFDEVEDVQGGNQVVLAELVEAGRLGVGIGVEQRTDVVLVGLDIFGLLGFEEVGLGGALEESVGRGLAGKSSDVFMEHAVSFFSFELDSLLAHRLLSLLQLLRLLIQVFSLLNL